MFSFLSLLGNLLILFGVFSGVTLKTTYAATAPTLNLSALPGTITQGQSSTLQWSATGTHSCTASGGWSGTQPVQGAMIISPAFTTTYALACRGPEDSKVEASVTVAVLSLTFSALPVSIIQGHSSTLRWSVTGATSCTASGGWSGPKEDDRYSVQVVQPASTTTYTLTCSRWSGGSVAKSVTITVYLPSPPQLTFFPSPGTITQGQSSALRWRATGATSCTASGGWSGPKRTHYVVDPTSSLLWEAVHPASTTTYTLTCDNSGGSVAQSVTVTVEVPPPLKLLLHQKEFDRPLPQPIPEKPLLEQRPR